MPRSVHCGQHQYQDAQTEVVKASRAVSCVMHSMSREHARLKSVKLTHYFVARRQPSCAWPVVCPLSTCLSTGIQ